MLILTWHPTYAFFRNPAEWGVFEIDLDRFARMVRGELTEKDITFRTIIRPTVKDVRNVVDRSLKHFTQPWVSLDIETKPMRKSEVAEKKLKNGKTKLVITKDWSYTGKQPLRAKLKVVGMGNSEWAVSQMWGTNPSVEAEMIKIIQDPKIVKVVHNGAWFDNVNLRVHGVKVVNYMDTRSMRRALSSTARLSLANVTSIYTDFIDWKNAEDDK